MSRLRSPGLAAGVITAVLWLVGGLIHMLTASSVYAVRVISFFGVGPLQARFWNWPGLWAPIALLLTSLILIAVVLVIVDHVAARGNRILITWLAVVLAATILGLSIDVMGVLTYLPKYGWQGLTTAGVEAGMSAAYWGVFAGWIPALLTVRMRQSDEPLGAGVAAVTAAILSILLFVIVGSFGVHAWQRQIAEETAEAQGVSTEEGALPDPLAAGDPVPSVAPDADVPAFDTDSCTPDNSMLLLGASDAAVGHRVQQIRLMNFSEQPCVIQGYPDIALADQNGHELDTGIAPGSSYMATDAGAITITIPAQSEAVTNISWDANSTTDQLVARTLFAAALPGLERGSWPVELDIIAGTQLEITAWELAPPATNP